MQTKDKIIPLSKSEIKKLDSVMEKIRMMCLKFYVDSDAPYLKVGVDTYDNNTVDVKVSYGIIDAHGKPVQCICTILRGTMQPGELVWSRQLN